MQTRLFFSLLVSLFVAAASVTHAQKAPDGKPQTGLPKITLHTGGQKIIADVAATDKSREIGLMYRKQMGKNEGMFFVFPQPSYYAMWMKNCFINIAVAYIADDGTIVSIHEMEAFSEKSHQAAGPVRYALEMNAKWFADHNVKVGDVIKGIEKAPKVK